MTNQDENQGDVFDEIVEQSERQDESTFTQSMKQQFLKQEWMQGGEGWLKQQYEKLKIIMQAHGLLMGIGVFFVVVILIGAGVLLFTPSSHPMVTVSQDNAQINLLIKNVGDIQEELLGIAHSQKTHPDNNQQDISKVEAQLNALTTSVSALSLQMQQTLSASSASIEERDDAIGAKLGAVSQSLEAIKQSYQPIQYLKPGDLPFEVISIDSIEGSSVVSVSYDYKTSALDVGFNLAGWELLSASYAKQRAEFINKQNQHVIIQLDRLGEQQ